MERKDLRDEARGYVTKYVEVSFQNKYVLRAEIGGPEREKKECRICSRFIPF
ncbi:MAG: hypothetical protein ACUVRX_00605 [Actinomycetota bacterium]